MLSKDTCKQASLMIRLKEYEFQLHYLMNGTGDMSLSVGVVYGFFWSRSNVELQYISRSGMAQSRYESPPYCKWSFPYIFSYQFPIELSTQLLPRCSRLNFAKIKLKIRIRIFYFLRC